MAASAEVKKVQIARGFAIPHLPIMIMEHDSCWGSTRLVISRTIPYSNLLETLGDRPHRLGAVGP
jgi:hypothetical protein